VVGRVSESGNVALRVVPRYIKIFCIIFLHMSPSSKWVPSLKFSHLNLSYINLDSHTFHLPRVSNIFFFSLIIFDDSTDHESRKLLKAFKNCCFLYNFGVEIRTGGKEFAFGHLKRCFHSLSCTLSLASSVSLSQHVQTTDLL